MMMWPTVTLLGFLVLTALVIAMGTRSTARYERERAELTAGSRHTVAEPVGAAAASSGTAGSTERTIEAPPLRQERAGLGRSGGSEPAVGGVQHGAVQ